MVTGTNQITVTDDVDVMRFKRSYIMNALSHVYTPSLAHTRPTQSDGPALSHTPHTLAHVSNAHTLTHTHIQALTHTHTHTHTDTERQTRPRTHTLTGNTHSHAQTHTHTQMQTYPP